jgi:hypothetical protein
VKQLFFGVWVMGDEWPHAHFYVSRLETGKTPVVVLCLVSCGEEKKDKTNLILVHKMMFNKWSCVCVCLYVSLCLAANMTLITLSDYPLGSSCLDGRQCHLIPLIPIPTLISHSHYTHINHTHTHTHINHTHTHITLILTLMPVLT